MASHSARLTAFYTYYAPHKLAEVDELLAKYTGKEASLFTAVEQKYVGSGGGGAAAAAAAEKIAGLEADVEQLETLVHQTTNKLGQQSAHVAGLEVDLEDASGAVAKLAACEAELSELRVAAAERAAASADASVSAAAENALAELRESVRAGEASLEACEKARDTAVANARTLRSELAEQARAHTDEAAALEKTKVAMLEQRLELHTEQSAVNAAAIAAERAAGEVRAAERLEEQRVAHVDVLADALAAAEAEGAERVATLRAMHADALVDARACSEALARRVSQSAEEAAAARFAAQRDAHAVALEAERASGTDIAGALRAEVAAARASALAAAAEHGAHLEAVTTRLDERSARLQAKAQETAALEYKLFLCEDNLRAEREELAITRALKESCEGVAMEREDALAQALEMQALLDQLRGVDDARPGEEWHEIEAPEPALPAGGSGGVKTREEALLVVRSPEMMMLFQVRVFSPSLGFVCFFVSRRSRVV